MKVCKRFLLLFQGLALPNVESAVILKINAQSTESLLSIVFSTTLSLSGSWGGFTMGEVMSLPDESPVHRRALCGPLGV